MGTNFVSYLDAFGSNDLNGLNFLTVNHIANISYLENFISSDSIPNNYLGEECEVFKEHYLYMFYGRPAFRLSDIHAYPICFMFSFENQAAPKKIFPFDSGAYFHKRMDDYFEGTSSSLDDFELSTGNDCVKKLVNHFFGGNEKYYDCLPIDSLSIDTNYPIVESYWNMIINKSEKKLDERKSTIELIYDLPFSFINNGLELIVLPGVDFYIGGEEVEYHQLKQVLEEKYECVVDKYDVLVNDQISESYKQINNVVKKFLRNRF